MIKLEKENRSTLEIADIEALMPEDHLLRMIDAAVDFSFVYDLVRDLYSKDKGRPSADPVVLVKMVLIQHLYGIRSLRQTVKEIEVNIAYRWFLHFNLTTPIPHFATVSYAFRNRFTPEITEQIFAHVLEIAINRRYVDAEAIFIDSTHFKAAVNTKRKQKVVAEKAAKIYTQQLRKEVNADRIAHDKKEVPDDSDDDKGEPTQVTKSPTDPDAGIFRKGEHKTVFAYEAHTVCDKRNFILDVEVTAGNVHDSIPFDVLYDRVTEKLDDEILYVSADSAYKTPWICKKIFDDGRIFSTAYKAPSGKKGYFRPYEYVYDEYYDCVLCPENQVLRYAITTKEGKRQFKSDPAVCRSCPSRHKCTASKDCCKMIEKHLWAEYLERAEDVRHSDIGKHIYALRSRTIERVFADAKEKHGMRYTQHRGLAAVTNWVKLKYTAMNLKKLAMWMYRDGTIRLNPPCFQVFSGLLQHFFTKRKPCLALA